MKQEATSISVGLERDDFFGVSRLTLLAFISKKSTASTNIFINPENKLYIYIYVYIQNLTTTTEKKLHQKIPNFQIQIRSKFQSSHGDESSRTLRFPSFMVYAQKVPSKKLISRSNLAILGSFRFLLFVLNLRRWIGWFVSEICLCVCIYIFLCLFVSGCSWSSVWSTCWTMWIAEQ